MLNGEAIAAVLVGEVGIFGNGEKEWRSWRRGMAGSNAMP